MPKSVSTRSAYKMLTCIYLCRTLLFFAPYADFLCKNRDENLNNKNILIIDDITTSCTTVAEMVRTIKAEWPDAKCYLFCLARTNHEMNANVNL